MSSRRAAVIACLLAVFGLSACGTPPPSASSLLRDVTSQLASISTVHFVITSSGASGSGVYVVGGEGDVRRPDSLRGQFQIQLSGIPVTLQVVSTSAGFYLQSPLSTKWLKANPVNYDFSSPGTLMNQSSGLPLLLAHATDLSLGSTDRLNGEQLYEVRCHMPGTLVATLLQDANPSQPVNTSLGIDTSTHQLRRIVFSGPLLTATGTTTYTVVLTNYGESVSVTAPPV